MYIMSQDGRKLAKLDRLTVEESPLKNDPAFYVWHTTTASATSIQKFGEYPTEAQAMAQLAGIAAALLRGTPIYCFDK